MERAKNFLIAAGRFFKWLWFEGRERFHCMNCARDFILRDSETRKCYSCGSHRILRIYE